jgi:hypothetical protein
MRLIDADAFERAVMFSDDDDIQDVIYRLRDFPSAQPQYEELTPEEAASEIASGSMVSALYWLDAMIRLKQMGYVICRKK